MINTAGHIAWAAEAVAAFQLGGFFHSTGTLIKYRANHGEGRGIRIGRNHGLER